ARAIRELPFVYVFGRSHFAISYFGANVFPEMVQVALEQPELVAHVTGKFVMHVVADADQNLAFAVELELAPAVTAPPPPLPAPPAGLGERAAESLQSALLRLDPEYAAYVPPRAPAPAGHAPPVGRPRVVPDRRQAPLLAAHVRYFEHGAAGLVARFLRGDMH